MELLHPRAELFQPTMARKFYSLAILSAERICLVYETVFILFSHKLVCARTH